MTRGIVVADTSVLFNFLRINRMDLIGTHPESFIATDHVAGEITDPDQQARYAAALSADFLAEQRVDDPVELEVFLRLRRGGRLGAGECSAIAVALNRGYRLAIQDNRAIKRGLEEAGITGNPLRIARTQDIVVELIRSGALTVATANGMLVDWAENHRFRLKISSFQELL